MLCTKCNTQNPYGTPVCNNCGAPFENGGAAISPPMMHNQPPKITQPVSPVQPAKTVQPVKPVQPMAPVQAPEVLQPVVNTQQLQVPQIQTQRAAVGTTLTYENLETEKKIKSAKTTAQLALVMGVGALFSLVLGIFYPILWALCFLLPIPALICSSVSNTKCRKYKKDEKYEEEVRKIKAFNRYAKISSILTIVLTVLIIIVLIALIILFSVASLESALGKFNGVFNGITRLIEFFETYF